jgi:hypothetical protein
MTEQYPTREQIDAAVSAWVANRRGNQIDLTNVAALKDHLHALFPQPTPSAEPSEQAPGSDLWAHRTSPNTIAVRRGYRIVLSLTGDDEAGAVARSILGLIPTAPAAPAAPPGIADMAPGTTFLGRHVRGAGLDDRLVLWTVERTSDPHGPIVESETGAWRFTTVDPSTIRDVTPPPTTQEGTTGEAD